MHTFLGHNHSMGGRSRASLILTGAVGLLAVVVSLTGCAPAAPTPSHSPSGAHPSSPTPTANPVVAPALAFGGDCNTVLSATTATSLMGKPVVLVPAEILTYPSPDAVQLRGGLRCRWNKESVAGSPDLTVVALSTKGLVTPTPDSQSCETHPNPAAVAVNCRASLTVGGYWFSWIIFNFGQNQAVVTAKSTAVGAALRASAATAGAAPTFALPHGSWTSPMNCTAVASASGLPGVLSTPGLVESQSSQNLDTGNPLSGQAAAIASASSSCSWVHNGQGDGSLDPIFTLTEYPGAAWYLKNIETTQGAAGISIPGTSGAVQVPADASIDRDGSDIAVTDGVNLLLVHWNVLKFTTQDSTIPKVLSTLDG